MIVARPLLVVALALAVPAHADDPGTRYQAPSEPPMLLPWKVGQWATYELKTAKGTSTANVIVIAEDTCGFWLDIEISEGDQRTDTRLCVARTPTQAPTEAPSRIKYEVTGRGRDITKADDLDDPLASRMLADATTIFDTSWSGQRGLKREDVTTPAGTFLAALAQTPGSMQRWSHPEVPITGIVKQIDGTTELVLTSFGLTRSASAMRDDARAIVGLARNASFMARPRKLWMMYQLGSSYFGTLDAAESAEVLGFSLGVRVGSSIGLVFGTTAVSAVTYAPKPELLEDLSLVHAGLRWYPYATTTGRWAPLQRGIYLQGDLGFAQVERGNMDGSSVVGRGGVAGARLGITTSIVQDWKLALEVAGHGALLNADEGTRIHLAFLAVIELYMPSLW